MPTRLRRTLSLSLLTAATLPTAGAATVLLDTFALGAGLQNAAAYDPLTDTVWSKTGFGDFLNYNRSGALLATVTDSTPSDDSDFTISRTAVNIGGTTVPAGTLLYANGDAPGGARLYARDRTTGATLAQVAIPTASAGGSFNGNLVGAAYSVARGSFFLLSYAGNRIMEFNAANGQELNLFGTNPVGANFYSVFYGDIEVNEATGNLLIVSSNNPSSVLRELTPGGALVGDVSMAGLGVTGESGLGLDNARGEMWISSTNGNLYRVAGFDAVPEPSSAATLAVAALGLLQRRRRTQG
jgi:uncharacterized protein (TIGR03382 family)